MTQDDKEDDIFVAGLNMVRDLFAVIGIVAAMAMTVGYFWGLLG